MSDKQLQPASNPLATLLSDPDRLRDFPVETVERLFAMDRELRADRARQEYAAAMNRAQSELEPVRKEARNTQTGSKYAKLEHIERMLIPVITSHGFSVSCSQGEGAGDEMMRVVMLVRHVGGHEERHHLDAPQDHLGPKGNPVKTRLHGMGSSFSYARRHLLCQVFGVETHDDADGNRPNSSASITETQAADLDALIEEVSADRGKFLAFFRIKASGELPASRHREAVRMLEAKRK